MELRRSRSTAAVLLAVLIGAALTACGSKVRTLAPLPTGGAQRPPALATVSLDAGEKLRVVATTSIVADVVANVGGDKIELTRLLPLGADPHAYEPTPRDLRAVADAHLIFVNGVGLEAFLDEMIRNAGGNAPIVTVSDGIELIEHDSDEGAEHGAADPHTWFDPNNVVIWVDNIEHGLAARDPANAEVYAANARAYTAKLEALDGWIRAAVAQIPRENRKIVTDHRVLGYFADEYEFEFIGAVIEAHSAAAEPSAQELVALETKLRQYNVPAVFVGRTVNPKLAQRIAEDSGVQLVPLYTGSLSEPGSEAGTYIDFMHYNVNAIVTALNR